MNINKALACGIPTTDKASSTRFFLIPRRFQGVWYWGKVAILEQRLSFKHIWRRSCWIPVEVTGVLFGFKWGGHAKHR